MEQKELCYPNEELSDVMHYQETEEKVQKIKKESQIELYRRFPWLEFKNQNLKRKYVYLGRDTEVSHPFYVRFNLREENSQASQDSNNQITEKLRTIVDSIINSDKKGSEGLDSLKSFQTASYNNYSVHYGYLLTGIAKPSIRVNQIYDSLFVNMLKSNQKITEYNESGFNSDMGSMQNQPTKKSLYNVMKLNWDYKHHSYEYFLFMSKAFKTLIKKLEVEVPMLLPAQEFRQASISKEQIEEFSFSQLFNQNEAKQLKYLNENGEQVSINDKDYYKYFFEVFKRHHEQIINLQPQQSSNENQPKRYKMMIGNKEHQLYSFDYQTYFEEKFKQITLTQQSLNNMIKFNRERTHRIIHTFPFKTQYEKINLLKQLENHNQQAYNRIQLLPLLCDKTSATSIEQDQHFLILFMRDQQQSLGNAYCLKDIVIKPNSLKGSIIQKLQFHKQSMLYDLHRFHSSKYPLLNHLSYDPDSIICSQDGFVTPSFEKAMIKMLELDQIPLTQQQELMMCTPTNDINIYEQLEKIAEEYLHIHFLKDGKAEIQQEVLVSFCERYSDKQKGIQFFRGQENNTIEIEEDALEPADSDKIQDIIKSFSLKLRLLQISMIDFQLKESHYIKCLRVDPQKNQGDISRQPYSTLNPAHFKELRQYLIILLIQTLTIKNISFKILYSIKNLPKTSKSFQQTNIICITEIEKLFSLNCTKYRNCAKYHIESHKNGFRIANQETFRKSILQIYQEIQNRLFNYKYLSEIMKVSFKAYIVLEILETKQFIINIRKGQNKDYTLVGALQAEMRNNLIVFKDLIERIFNNERNANRNDILKQKWQTVNQRFYNELKEVINSVQVQFSSCRSLLRNKLNSKEAQEAMRKRDDVDKKIAFVAQCNLVLFSSIFSQIGKFDDNKYDGMNLLYKILLCFGCHLKQFPKNELLRYQISSQYTLQKLEPKIYKMKAILIEELYHFRKTRNAQR